MKLLLKTGVTALTESARPARMRAAASEVSTVQKSKPLAAVSDTFVAGKVDPRSLKEVALWPFPPQPGVKEFTEQLYNKAGEPITVTRDANGKLSESEAYFYRPELPAGPVKAPAPAKVDPKDLRESVLWPFPPGPGVNEFPEQMYNQKGEAITITRDANGKLSQDRAWFYRPD